MAKHDVGERRRRGSIFGIKLSSEPGYDIDDVMGGMIFDDNGNRIDRNVTEEEFYAMRSKIGEDF